uniref:F-box domain-containing protein n=1 Tax=Cajanus cajan TaxID=3821 RepID=A0A151U8X2_CAJCA|nr:hypothetical protein KK1_019843 [Cajanus cajan]
MALGPDQAFEIFSHFPATTIFKFRHLSKSFSNLVEETYFVKKQIHNSLEKDNTCFFLQHETSQKYNNRVKFYPLPGKQSSSNVFRDVLEFLSYSSKVLASTKGLIICRTTSKIPTELFICNPATKCWLPIPSPVQLQENPDIDLIILLLECYNDSDDYMVLHFENPTDWFTSNYACKILKPEEGIWKPMEKSFFAGRRSVKFNMPVHQNGIIHFISDCFPYLTRRSPYFEPYIMSYNLHNGTSKMLKLPQNARKVSYDVNCDMGIFNWGKVSTGDSSICLVRLKGSTFKVWILKDYGSNRWMRILKVRIEDMGLREECPKIKGFTVMNDALLIFATEKRIHSCGLTNKNYMKIEKICEHECKSNVCFTPFLDTLRPCGPEATTLHLP